MLVPLDIIMLGFDFSISPLFSHEERYSAGRRYLIWGRFGVGVIRSMFQKNPHRGKEGRGEVKQTYRSYCRSPLRVISQDHSSRKAKEC